MLCVCVCVRVLSSHFAVWLRVDDPNSNSLVDPSVPPQNRPQSPKIKGAKRAGRYLGLLSLGILGNAPDHLEVLLNHLLYQVVKRGAELPSDLLLGLGGIAEEKFDLSGAEVLGIDSTPISSTVPVSPVHLMVVPTTLKAFSTNSRTVWVSPVART